VAARAAGPRRFAIAFWLIRSPPRQAPSAAGVCAVGLLVARWLMPATRFGYLLYRRLRDLDAGLRLKG